MIAPQHFVRFYEDDVFLTEALASVIKMGLQVNDTLIVMVPASHRIDLRKVLTPDECANTHLMFFNPTSLLSKLMADAWPNHPDFMKVLGSRLQTICQTVPLRMLREMVAAVWAEVKYGAAIRLKELWNTLQTVHPFSRVHAYPHSAFTSKDDLRSLHAILHEHPHVHHQKTGHGDGGRLRV